MQKWIIGASVLVLLLVSIASAYAFSASLMDLRIHIGSFAQPNVAAPMTYFEETEIGAPQPNMVRFQTVEQAKDSLCQRDKRDTTVGF